MKQDKVACKNLNIFQNNIKSIRPKETREELLHYLKENDIAIAVLQEIWLKMDEHFRIPNYKIESKRRNAGYGGVEISIREDTLYETVDLGCFLPVEVVAITITKDFDPITGISIYGQGAADRNKRENRTNLYRIGRYLRRSHHCR